MNRDLTVGNLTRVLWLFCMPLFGSIVFQQLYNIADSFVAGKFISENALAAVGNSYEVTLVFIAFAFGCNIGSSVVVSTLFGQRNFRDMKTAVYTSFISGAVLCVLLMLAGVFLCDTLLHLIHTPSEIFADSKLYLDIYIFGLPFMFFYNVSTGIFSALGDSKTPFIFLAASSTSNIAMDILFVKGFGMGVDGVAWATFICQGISALLAVFFVFKRLCKIHTDQKTKIFDKKLFLNIVKIALPSTLQQSFISVGNIMVQGIINGFGSAVMAGYSASVKLNNLVITSFTTLANGISNYTAQNIGAEKYDRVKRGFAAGLKMVWILSLPLAITYFFFGNHLVNFFIDNPTKEAVQSGFTYLRILSPFYFAVSAKLVADGILRGAGKMKQFMLATFTDLILRVVLAYALSRTALGSVGIWCAWPVGWVVATVISLYICRIELKKQLC